MSSVGGPFGGPQGDRAVLDRLLAERQVMVVVGPGGVGKTTMAAALGLRAAREHGRRVVVVTVDPARRLAEALGVARLTEEAVLVPGAEPGRVWALMIDMARSWDRLVETVGPDPGTIATLQANPLYQTLTRRFVQSHDYVALDHLLTLGETGRYDLIVVDTPPSSHAIDLLDAPGRMIEFFDSRLLRWLTAGSGLGAATARPFLALAERILGTGFLGQIVDFFTVFAQLRPGFVDRARRLEQRLKARSTATIVVTTTDPPVIEACDALTTALRRRDRRPDLVVANRLPPVLEMVPAGAVGRPGDPGQRAKELRLSSTPDLGDIADPSLAGAIDQMMIRARAARLPQVSEQVPTIGLALAGGELGDLMALDRMLRSPRAV